MRPLISIAAESANEGRARRSARAAGRKSNVQQPVRVERIFSIPFVIIIASILVSFTGCAGYQAGPVNGVPAGARAVTVQPFRNDTFEPRLTEAVDFALRRRIQQDGTYRLDTQNDGEIVVTGVITHMTREPLAFQPNDVVTPLDYDLRIIATVTATERLSGKEIFKKEFIGRTPVRATANRDQAERQSEPTVAEDLARNITSALTEGAW